MTEPIELLYSYRSINERGTVNMRHHDNTRHSLHLGRNTTEGGNLDFHHLPTNLQTQCPSAAANLRSFVQDRTHVQWKNSHPSFQQPTTMHNDYNGKAIV